MKTDVATFRVSPAFNFVFYVEYTCIINSLFYTVMPYIYLFDELTREQLNDETKQRTKIEIEREKEWERERVRESEIETKRVNIWLATAKVEVRIMRHLWH